MLEEPQNKLFKLDFTIKVQDFGHGMTSEGVKKLFNNYSTLKENIEINQRGTGLGLSICKRLVDQMKGKIQVSSKVGEGTTFELSFKALSIEKDLGVENLFVNDAKEEDFEDELSSVNFEQSVSILGISKSSFKL